MEVIECDGGQIVGCVSIYVSVSSRLEFALVCVLKLLNWFVIWMFLCNVLSRIVILVRRRL